MFLATLLCATLDGGMGVVDAAVDGGADVIDVALDGGGGGRRRGVVAPLAKGAPWRSCGPAYGGCAARAHRPCQGRLAEGELLRPYLACQMTEFGDSGYPCSSTGPRANLATIFVTRKKAKRAGTQRFTQV